jgi:hypothetical protein
VGEKLNAFISLYSLKAKEEVENSVTKEAEINVEAKPDSSAVPKDDVQPSKKRSASGKNNKKVVA